jgi:hypothetical protein
MVHNTLDIKSVGLTDDHVQHISIAAFQKSADRDNDDNSSFGWGFGYKVLENLGMLIGCTHLTPSQYHD